MVTHYQLLNEYLVNSTAMILISVKNDGRVSLSTQSYDKVKQEKRNKASTVCVTGDRKVFDNMFVNFPVTTRIFCPFRVWA
jgi:hypothetical protein